MTKAVSEFISHLVVHFGEPKFDAPEENRKKVYHDWLASMNSNLKSYPDGTLAKAAQIIIATRKYRNFPMVSECLDACGEAQKWLNANKEQLDLGKRPDNFPEWHPAREKLAYELLDGALGKRAAKEGWVLALFDFTRKNMRLPDQPFEIANCIASAKGFDVAYGNCVRGECGPLSRHLTELGTSMLAKREALKLYVETGVMP